MIGIYGRDKWITERGTLRRWAYCLFGELHVPARLRSYHVLRVIRTLGLSGTGVRVLDAGCGRGDLAMYMARHKPAWFIAGLDIDAKRVQDSLAVAEEHRLRNVTFVHQSIEEATYNGEYDLIIAADVIEHITDDVHALSVLYRALKRSGVIIITAPANPDREHFRLLGTDRRCSAVRLTQLGHVRAGYSACELQARCDAIGARLLACYPTFGFFGTLALDIFDLLGGSHPQPLLFLLAFPGLLALTWLDLHFPSVKGSGVLALLQKD